MESEKERPDGENNKIHTPIYLFDDATLLLSQIYSLTLMLPTLNALNASGLERESECIISMKKNLSIDVLYAINSSLFIYIHVQLSKYFSKFMFIYLHMRTFTRYKEHKYIILNGH
jgi:hypothetical protein